MKRLLAFAAALCLSSFAMAQIPSGAAAHKRVAIASWRSVWGLDAPVASFAAQVHQESGWNPDAKSRVGAMGLTQFMPSTAKDINARFNNELGSLTLYSPVWALKAQAIYMKQLYDANPAKNPCEQMAFALSSYNGGQGWTNKRKKLSTDPKICMGVTCAVNPGILPSNQRENEDYPKRILLGIEPRYVEAMWGKGSCKL